MHALPFDKPGQFYRGNLHTHSTRSDGALPMQEVLTAYADRGYDFISLTDHFLPAAHFAAHRDDPGFVTVSNTQPFDTDTFVTIPGAELHGPAMENGEMWHVVAVGLPLDFAPLADGETGLSVVHRAREAGAWISLAHPHWNAVSEADALAVMPDVHAIEVYNHSTEVNVHRGWGTHLAEVLTNKGHRLGFNAADDAHFKNDADPWLGAFGGWVMVKAPSRTATDLLAALKAGHYYSSTGPDFHNVQLDGDRIIVETSPVEAIIVYGRGAKFRRTHATSTIRFEAELPPIEESPHVRVMIVDAHGQSAWTNPIWREH